MAQDKYISGIYNYCDKWCEKCTLTKKCFLYAKEQKQLAKHKEKGENPNDLNVVMQDIKESFSETLKLLRKDAKKHGIDITALPEVESEEHDPSGHPLMQTAKTYLKLSHSFLEKLRKIIQEEGGDLIERTEIIPSAANDIGTLRQIVSSYDVILWYHALISVKIHRALQDKMDADEFSQTDADASAKIAYIGVMKSMDALKTIYNWNKALQDDALTLLAKTENLKKGINEEFPGHITFKRPGFDT
ncbi:MAG: hypothetical protein PHX21_04150 [bacterium]|nr:hypothetical protein [bacterium]